jgi:hypothetical protein
VAKHAPSANSTKQAVPYRLRYALTENVFLIVIPLLRVFFRVLFEKYAKASTDEGPQSKEKFRYGGLGMGERRRPKGKSVPMLSCPDKDGEGGNECARNFVLLLHSF